ncbi:MAG: phasin family protein [Pseudomonadota bacterium]
MTKAQKNTAGSNDPMAAWAELQKAGLGPLAASGTAWSDGVQQYFQEMSRFLTMRFEKDVETQKQVLACRDPEELRGIQAKFIQEALSDYHEETSRLMEIGRTYLDKASEPAKGKK